jgi:hypothetical protein
MKRGGGNEKKKGEKKKGAKQKRLLTDELMISALIAARRILARLAGISLAQGWRAVFAWSTMRTRLTIDLAAVLVRLCFLLHPGCSIKS